MFSEIVMERKTWVVPQELGFESSTARLHGPKFQLQLGGNRHHGLRIVFVLQKRVEEILGTGNPGAGNEGSDTGNNPSDQTNPANPTQNPSDSANPADPTNPSDTSNDDTNNPTKPKELDVKSLSPEIQGLVTKIVPDLLSKLSSQTPKVNATDIKVIKVEAVDWNDGSLGCPEPGMNYTQAIVPGYSVILSVNNRENYEYHTNKSNVFVLCKK